ncbi:hypothetical protein CIPAW_05G121100 [Carya illinoinensis]|uniref:Uncharacterized protein n=1 Tax=Carya illinoinensis TaxID=32201 RepID=A0A8T1QIC1_CARIL|nr:hypothetical protein CIPAW_05G121100 [Carya illinoinensis]
MSEQDSGFLDTDEGTTKRLSSVQGLEPPHPYWHCASIFILKFKWFKMIKSIPCGD